MKKIENLNQEKVMNILMRLDFFDAFTDEEKAFLFQFHSNFFVYEPGEYIIREHSSDTTFFILLSGTVNINKGPMRLHIAELGPGDFFGEVSFLTNTPRTTNVVADDTVIVIMVDKNMLDLLTAEIREKIKDKIIEKLVRRLDHMNTAVLNLSI